MASLTEQQKARIVELARQSERELAWASHFDPRDNVHHCAAYTAYHNSAEAFRIAQQENSNAQ